LGLDRRLQNGVLVDFEGKRSNDSQILHSVVAVTEKFITELCRELAIAREVSEKRRIVKPLAATILQSIPNRKIKIILLDMLEDISNS
jgi:hypothetical protein